jgi:preprotein translocase subunit YajC
VDHGKIKREEEMNIFEGLVVIILAMCLIYIAILTEQNEQRNEAQREHLELIKDRVCPEVRKCVRFSASSR